MKEDLRVSLEARRICYRDTELANVLSRLLPLTEKGPWIGGGAARKAYYNTPLDTDIDVFFPNAVVLEDWIAAVNFIGWHVARDLPHVFEFHVPDQTNGKDYHVVQLIRSSFYADAAALLADFDFSICQFVYDGACMHFGEYAKLDKEENRLRAVNTHTPVASLIRIAKYALQGYTMHEREARGFLNYILENPESVAKPMITVSGSERSDRAGGRPWDGREYENNAIVDRMRDV